METRRSVRQFILANYLFSDDESLLRDDVSLIEKGTMDSTGVLELIMHLEQAFGIRVADDEMLPQNLDSVDHIVAFVERKRATGGQ